MGASTTLAGWDLALQATWLDPRNQSGAQAGRQLPRRSRRGARLDADRDLGSWRLGASLIAKGARFDDAGNSLRLGGYATLDLRAEHTFGDSWTLQGGIRNAFDREYESVAYYRQPGRELTMTLRYAPNGG